MSEIKVEAYSGYKSDQRPMRFILQNRTYEILDVEDQWYSPLALYFRVRADDGNIYILRHDEVQDCWTLDGFRAAK